MQPETKYAKSGDINIAYQVVGEGPLDLVFVPGAISHLELDWEEPSFARFLNRLASFSRLIKFDKRGTGLSDRVSVNELPTLEQRMDDVRAVMDAAGSETAAVIGISEGGSMSALFAATYPERVSALVLYGAFAFYRGMLPGEPGSVPRALLAGATRILGSPLLYAIEKGWGRGLILPLFAPSRASDPKLKEWFARLERLGPSPTRRARR